MKSLKRIYEYPKEHEHEHDDHLDKEGLEKFCMLDFYSNLKQKTMVRLKAKNQDILKSNSGLAFIYFENTHKIHEFEQFLKTYHNKLEKKFKKLNIYNWSFMHAPMPSNIIWDNFGNKIPYDYLTDFLLNVLLFFSTIVLSSTFFDSTLLIQSFVGNNIGEDSSMYIYIVKAIKPLAMATFNSFFIPTIVLYTTEFLFFEMKSQRVKSRMNKMFFYLMMSTIILPITKLDDIGKLFEFVS